MKFKYQAKKLKELREEVGLTQKEMGRKMGLKNGQIVSNAERGMCPIQIERLIKVFKTNDQKQQIIDAKVRDYELYLHRKFFPTRE